jgi:23S rRNA (cytosine1962-C5)-methyltransferase
LEKTTAIEIAWARRQGKLGAETTAFRLFNGKNDGILGLVIEVFSTIAIFQIHSGKYQGTLEETHELAEWCLSKFHLKAVYLKEFVADRSHEKEDKRLKDPTPFAGTAVPPEITVLENGHTFAIKPYDGFSCGLFLDQRANRKFLADRGQGKRVLNCFSYTCGFSVYAAKAGAKTTSVDLSKRFLEWGKTNFALNGIALEEHRFIPESIFDYAKKAQKREEKFDLIILDPPSFSRDKIGKVWAIEKNYEKLVDAVLPLLADTGEIFFSSNFTGWSRNDFVARLSKTKLGKWKRGKLPDVPIDFQSSEHPLHAEIWQKPAILKG